VSPQDLETALQFERTVNRDNTVSFQNLRLQLEAVRWRGSLAGCTVTVHQHLDGTVSLTHGPHRLADTMRTESRIHVDGPVSGGSVQLPEGHSQRRFGRVRQPFI
jgi:hypothetical protein